MKLRLICLLSSTLLATSTPALAAGPLTQEECNAYPFVQTNGPVTHKDLIKKLSLLESVGYDEAEAEADDYPQDILLAERKLHAKYVADCRPSQVTALDRVE